MSRKKRVSAGVGVPCAKCGVPSVKFRHPDDFVPRGNKGWYPYWFECQNPNCKTTTFMLPGTYNPATTMQPAAAKPLPHFTVKECRRTKREPKQSSLFAPPKDPFWQSKEWQTLRYATLKRYGLKCMCCGAHFCELHVDHIKPRSKYPELALDPENLQVLCKACNKGKGAWDETDFRPKLQPEGVA